MWKSFWTVLSNDRGQVPSGDDQPAGDTQSSDSNVRATEDDSYGVRVPYDSEPANTEPAQPDTSEPTQQDQQTQQDDSFASDLNLDPSTFSPENREVFKRMQGAYTKRMQKIKGWEKHLGVMDQFFNDKSYAEQALRQWAQQNGYQVSQANSPFNNQQTTQPSTAQQNALQAKIVEALKAKLPQETQWMADGQGAAIFEAMREVLSPVLEGFKSIQTDKEKQEWQALETQYEEAESKFAEKHPGWESREEEMSDLLAFMQSPKQYVHPVYGSKHELLWNLLNGNASAIKQATERVNQVPKNKTPTGTVPKRNSLGQFTNIQDEVAATADRNDAFAKAATYALQQVKGRR